MCQFLSCIVLKNGDVLHSPLLNSHSDLVRLFQLPDDHAHHQHFAKVELTPPSEWKGWEDVSTWNFRVDEPTIPAWWSDIAQSAEESVRNIIRRAILPQGEHDFHVDGLALVGPGVTVRSMRNARAYLYGGTISEVWGGTISAVRGGTISAVWGGTISEVWGGTISEVCGGTISAVYGGTISAVHGGTISEVWGGTISAVRGGTISAVWGGTISEVWGGTISAVCGGTISAVHGGTISEVHGGTISEVYGGTISAVRGGTISAVHKSAWGTPCLLFVAKGVKLNAVARKFIVKPPTTRKRKATTKAKVAQ